MRRMTMLLGVFLSLASCSAGDFCDVVPGPKLFAPETSAVMVRTDRPDVDQIAVENEYGRRHCGW